MPPGESRGAKLTGLTLDTSDLVLSTLKNAAQLSQVPYLQEAAGLALGIINIIQDVKGNQEAFRRLANDACGLVYAILCNTGFPTSTAAISPSLLDNIRELLKKLHEIEKFAKKKISQNKIARIIRHKSDVGVIQEYREAMKHSLDIFGLKSTITIQEHISQITERQEELIREIRAQDERRAEHEAARLEEARERQERIQRENAEREKEREKIEQERIQREARERERRENERLQRESLEKEEQERQRSEREQLSRGKANDATREPKPHGHATPISMTNPFGLPSHPLPLDPYSTCGKFKMTTIGGDQNAYSNSTINTNSGNTTTTTISNSNNDSSIRMGGGRGRRNYV